MQPQANTNRFVYLKKSLDSRFDHRRYPLTPPALNSSYELIGEDVEITYPHATEVYPLAIPKKFDYSPLDDLTATCNFIAQECVKSDLLGNRNEGSSTLKAR
jgi:hypothetical protein